MWGYCCPIYPSVSPFRNGTWRGIGGILHRKHAAIKTPLLTYTQKSKKNKGKCQLFFHFLEICPNFPFTFTPNYIIPVSLKIWVTRLYPVYTPNFNYFNKKNARTSCHSRKLDCYSNIYIYIIIYINIKFRSTL